jgi:hypothetical protein
MKPGDFFVAVQDFFAVLLPGALLSWLAVQYVSARMLRDALLFGGASEPNDFVLGAALFVSSYVLGHFAFMLGAQLDPSYDRWRERTKPKDRDRAYQAALKAQKALNEDLLGGSFSTLKWANAYIQLKAAGARAEIDRLEADQKFFRSLVGVAALFAAHFILRQGDPVAGVVAVAFAILAYLRFRNRRWAMTELVFATAAILHATSPTSETKRDTAAAAS